MAPSRRQTEQPTNPNTKIPTTKSLTPSNSSLKGGFGYNSSRLSLNGSRKYFDSPNDSPKPYRSFGTKEEFGSRSKSQIILFKIYMEIASHRQGNSSITSYFKKLEVLWDQLAKSYSDNLADQYSSDAIEMLREHMEREKVMQFLVGLNDSYSSICSKILLMRPFPTVDTAFSVIIRKERRRRSIILSQEVVDEEKVSSQND